MASFSAQHAGASASAPANAAPQLFRRRDEGFTLVEVIWALFLIGLIAMGSLGLFLHSMKSIAHLQRQQVAVSLASSAMDAARSVSGAAVNAAGTSGLVKGRSLAAVESVWDEATAADSTDTADMEMVWDPEGGLTAADQWVPVRTTATVANQPYTIDTLVGACYRLKERSPTTRDCVGADPSDDAYVKLYRVRVVVRWDEGEAARGAHTYKVSSLVDPSEDATWNTALEPFAYDDEFSVNAYGDPSFHAIVANDALDYDVNGSTPVIIGTLALTPAGPGSVARDAAQGINGVVFTPSKAANARSGEVTFRYAVRDASGKISDQATVTVHILPSPVADVGADAITVETGSTTTLDALLTANDRGVVNISPSRKTTVVPVWDPEVDMFSIEDETGELELARVQDRQNLAAAGITVDGSGNVRFAAPSEEGAVTEFYYYLVDDPASGPGQRFQSAEPVRVAITTLQPVLTPNVTVDLNATSVAAWQSIDWRDITGNAPGTSINVRAITPNGSNNLVRRNGNAFGPGVASSLEFQRQANVARSYNITYSVVTAGGRDSGPAQTGIMTVRVLPVGANVQVNSAFGTATQTFSVPAANFVPASNVGIVEAAITSTTTCSDLSRPTNQPLQVRVRFTGSNKSCTLTFRVATTNINPALVSQGDVYTLTVTRP